MNNHQAETTAGTALVLVRATSPFLSHTNMAQREEACLSLAGRIAAETELITRTPESPTGVVERLCQRAATSQAAVVVTWSAFGLVTSPPQLTALVRLLDAGITIFEASSGDLVKVDADRLAAALAARPDQADQADQERRQHAARTRAGRRDVARQGRWLGGRRPLGWVFDEDGDASLDLTAAGHIRTATRRIAGGGSVGSVVAVWNHAGFTTLTGQPWTFGSARRVLLRPRNAGLVDYRGEIVGKSEWPAIVTVGEWAAARRRLESRRNRKTA